MISQVIPIEIFEFVMADCQNNSIVFFVNPID